MIDSSNASESKLHVGVPNINNSKDIATINSYDALILINRAHSAHKACISNNDSVANNEQIELLVDTKFEDNTGVVINLDLLVLCVEHTKVSLRPNVTC